MSSDLLEKTHSSLDGILAIKPLIPYVIVIMAIVTLWTIARSIATILVINKLKKAEEAGLYNDEAPEITRLNLSFAKLKLITNLIFFILLLVMSYFLYMSIYG